LNFIYENIPSCASLEPLPQSYSPDYILSVKIGALTYRIGIQQKSQQKLYGRQIVDEAKKFILIDTVF